MTLKGGFLVALSLLFLTFNRVEALTQDEFRTSLGNIKQSQKEAQRMISNLGLKTGTNIFESSSVKEEGEDKKKKNLITVYDHASRLRVQAGKFLFGKLHTRLIVGGEPSPAVVEIDSDQGVFSELRILGKARASGTEGRLAVDFDRLVLRSGKTIEVKAIAEDEAGALGLEAQVFSSKTIAVVGAMASSFISGLATSQQTQNTNPFGFGQVQQTGRNALLQGVAQTAADQSKRLIDDATKEKPVLVADVGTPVTIYFDEEVRF